MVQWFSNLVSPVKKNNFLVLPGKQKQNNTLPSWRAFSETFSETLKNLTFEKIPNNDNFHLNDHQSAVECTLDNGLDIEFSKFADVSSPGEIAHSDAAVMGFSEPHQSGSDSDAAGMGSSESHQPDSFSYDIKDLFERINPTFQLLKSLYTRKKISFSKIWSLNSPQTLINKLVSPELNLVRNLDSDSNEKFFIHISYPVLGNASEISELSNSGIDKLPDCDMGLAKVLLKNARYALASKEVLWQVMHQYLNAPAQLLHCFSGLNLYVGEVLSAVNYTVDFSAGNC